MKKILISAAVLAGFLSYAGGFRVSLQGVKQLAQAHTSAHAEDASVAFFNPAGISFIPSKLSVAAGGFGINSKVTIQNPSTLMSYETDNPMGTPIYAAIAYKVKDNISVGFSFATPFGSTVQYEDDWYGREMVQRIELKALYFQPMVSVKLAPWVSVGGSYIYAKGSVDWDRAATQLDGTLNLNDDEASGSGFGLGFYFQPDEKWDVSVAYRSPVDMEAENGVATFNVSSALYGNLGLDANGQDRFTATLPLVEEFTLGATYKVTPKWSISADFNYHGWERYDRLVVDFENAPVGNQEDPTVSVSEKNWKNAKSFRIGTQYMLNDKLAGRLGWYYDESPYDDNYFSPESPSFDNRVITAGLGYAVSKSFTVDVAGAYAFMKSRSFNNRSLNFSGQAKSEAYYFGLGLSYNAF